MSIVSIWSTLWPKGQRGNSTFNIVHKYGDLALSMQTISAIQSAIVQKGFAILNNTFTQKEVDALITHINNATASSPNFRYSGGLFAIRQFFKELPGIEQHVFTPAFTQLLREAFGSEYFVVKGIYFDKPGESNWFVAWHQDLTISVDKRLDIAGFGPWTVKQNQFAVQPPLAILQDNFTARIHLDDTDQNNGALKVLPGSHLHGIYRPNETESTVTAETCCVGRGGVMFMRPLLMHVSGRTTNNNQRRVLHIEFSRHKLPNGLQWAERTMINCITHHD